MNSFKLINSSCADVEADAVVNAANNYLQSGGGICGVIFRKCGSELINACSKYDVPLNDGDAVITPAFNLTTAKYIIHAVGPDFSKTPNAFDKLYLAYYNSLIVLKDNNLHSISFPLISSGIFGGRLEDAPGVSTEECIKAYKDFIKEYKDYEIDVTLCAFTKEEYISAKKIYDEMIGD